MIVSCECSSSALSSVESIVSGGSFSWLSLCCVAVVRDMFAVVVRLLLASMDMESSFRPRKWKESRRAIARDISGVRGSVDGGGGWVVVGPLVCGEW